jgi:class 3 adenylate cyclase
VLGENVNLASRLCDQACGMEVLIDEATRVLLPADSRYRPVEPLRLKGFRDSVAAYKLEVVNLQSSPIDLDNGNGNGNGALEISEPGSETAGS